MALTTTTLLNGLKSLFGASSSAPASTSRIPYCNSSNEVTGSTSLTDLASVLGGLSFTITHWIAKTKGVKIRHASYSSVLIEIIHYAGGTATAGWVVFSPYTGMAYTVFIHNNIGNYHLPTILVSKSKVSSFYELCIENTAGNNEETRLNIKPSRQVADLTLTEYSSAADRSLYNVVTPSFLVQ